MMPENEFTVCVIEADPAVRDSLEVLMGLSSIVVKSYASLNAFLQASETLKINCLLCEADMPDGSGILLYTKLLAEEACVPFALLISENKPLIYARAKEAGIKHIFRKPLVNPTELLHFVQQLHQEHQLRTNKVS